MSHINPSMQECLIAFGGNQGDVFETYRKVLAHMEAHPQIEVIRNSHLYSTAPVGSHAGGMFLNGAIRLETPLSAQQLLAAMLEIEQLLGRKRVLHWGPRIVDLDVIVYGNEIIATDELTIPHPACWYRRFVLDPVVQIAGEMLHPVRQATFQQLLERLQKPHKLVVLLGGDFDLRDELSEKLQPQFSDVMIETSDMYRLAVPILQSVTFPEPLLAFWLGGNDAGEKDLYRRFPAISRLEMNLEGAVIEETLVNVLRSILDAPYPVLPDDSAK
jgi:2-amino-4-hydroxy-6-hydroxymethyldihydropteridine diphosphokinase